MIIRKSSKVGTEFGGTWKIYLFLVILSLFCKVGCGNGNDNKAAYECPTEKTINCMPPVLPANQALCSGEYHDWIVANCPDVTFSQ